MGAPDRLVRRLRLTADSEDAVRRMLPRLEDALRCASLPDHGARLLVVRRLDLGLIPCSASAQQLSLLVEQRIALAGGKWVRGGTPAADRADFVEFSSALDARIELVRRIARGEACSAWYWPLAVREFRRGMPTEMLIREIVAAVLQWPEASVALPAWVRALVEGGVMPALLRAFDAPAWTRIVQAVGLRVVDRLHDDETNGSGATGGSSESGRADDVRIAGIVTDDAPHHALPPWLQACLNVTGMSIAAMDSLATRTIARSTVHAQHTRPTAVSVPHLPRASHGETPPVVGEQRADGSAKDAMDDAQPSSAPDSIRDMQGMRVQPDEAHALDVWTKTDHQARIASAHDKIDIAAPAPRLIEADGPEGVDADSRTHPWLAPTSCGGLFFLLPVLRHLGFADWAAAHCRDDAESAALVRRIFAHALLRLRVAAEDPVHATLGDMLPDRTVMQASTPASWHGSALRSPRDGSADLPASLMHATTRDTQARLWLTAVRRWLRRNGGIGLASLVLRPARLSFTATHLDLHFRANAVDLRVRRLGLDIDPGWLPWIGCVVGFHFREHME